MKTSDFLVIGAGVAGLSFALRAAEHGKVAVITKGKFLDCSSAKAQGGTVSELYGVTNGGAEAGYVAKVAASGSQGTITMMVGIDANGAITGISVVSHSETSGIGTKVVENKPNAAGTPVLDQFVGMSGAGTLAVGSNITAISGATVSTKGITMGANAALAAVEALG